MSAIAAILDGSQLPESGRLSAMLAAMRWRGDTPRQPVGSGPALLGGAALPWEREIGQGVGLASEGDLSLAFDGALYYRTDLQAALHARGVHSDTQAHASLVFAAYRAWGPGLADHLEGDFAFVLWDAETRTAVCARSPAGQRPLFLFDSGRLLIAASTVPGVLAHGTVPTAFNLGRLAACASGMLSVGLDDTAYEAVRALPAGRTLIWTETATHEVSSWRLGEASDEWSRAPEPEAARELARRLERAVVERMAPTGATAIWLSGGYDSPAVFASGARGLGEQGDLSRLVPITVTFPSDDPGNEDAFVRSVAEYWNVNVRREASSSLDMYGDLDGEARVRDEPFRAEFSGLHRGLAETSAAQGARVAFTGAGGDQNFDGSFVYWSDFLRTGRWVALWRDWQAWNRPGVQFCYRWALKPLIPRAFYPLIGAVRGGRRPFVEFERPAASFLDPAFVRRSGLRDREASVTPRPFRGSAARGEALWYASSSMMARLTATVTATALRAGVDLRHPLLDRRVAELSFQRPVGERRRLGEGKRLLRRAMADRLPASVLAKRGKRTGTPQGIFGGWIHSELGPWLERIQREPVALVELGIVDPTGLAAAHRAAISGQPDYGKALQLYHFLQTELWLRHKRNIAP
ncbi:MAG: asparagine synthase-related protein [Gemmatimonadota bacterium]